MEAHYSTKEQIALSGLISFSIASIGLGTYFEGISLRQLELPTSISSLSQHIELGKINITKVEGLSLLCFLMAALSTAAALRYIYKKESTLEYDRLVQDIEVNTLNR